MPQLSKTPVDYRL